MKGIAKLIKEERAGFAAEKERELQRKLETFAKGMRDAGMIEEEIEVLMRRYEVVLRKGGRP